MRSPSFSRTFIVAFGFALAATAASADKDLPYGVDAVRKRVKPTSVTVPAPDQPTVTGIGAVGDVIASPAGIGVVRSVFAAEPTQQQKNDQFGLAGDAGLKIYVTREGWYRLTRAEMIAAGYEPGNKPGPIALYTSGLEIPVTVDDGGDNRFDLTDALEFYGVGLDSISTGARTYWLRSANGKGARMAIAKAKPGVPLAASIPFTVERNERTYYISAVIDNGDQTNFFGAPILIDPTTQTLGLGAVDTAYSGNATLDVVVQGLTPDLHWFTVTINGHAVGTGSVTSLEQKTVTFTFPHSYLVSGNNTVVMQSIVGWWDASVVASTRLTYRHLLRADNGALEGPFTAGRTAQVGGFGMAAVRAIDVTDPARPSEIQTAVSSDGSGGYAASFTPSGSGDRVVLVFDTTRVQTPGEMALNRPSSWNAEKGGADLVIITHAGFAGAAATLRPVREQEGISTALVDVEDLYDEFNFGNRAPEAIRAFLQSGSRWKVPPHYVLLVGDASFDPRGYQGAGSVDFLPVKLVPTQYMKTASDDWYADLDGDGRPDLAVGRIPVRTTGEAERIFGRLVSRGTPSGAWSSRALFVTDGPYDYDFVAMANTVKPLFPAAWTISSVDAGSTATPGADTIAALNAGPIVVDYVGHGSVESWGLYPFFSSANASGLTNGAQLPFVVAMECLNGYFHDLYTESLAEALLKAPNGGAIAVWGSSTLTLPFDQLTMNQELFRQLFSGASPRIGDACRRAKLAITDPDVRSSWILFGDPSMKLK